jgi:crotonobetainyl-CoA:carnitine CoA-transferase CaiB-like acyl-CoA transferase
LEDTGYAFFNRGKRRITLDLKKASDRTIAQRLVDSTDAVVENSTNNPAGLPVSAPESELAHPLAGLKVVDLCLALAGPTCSRLLGEFGVLENFSPGTADRLGSGYQEVQARKPDLIYTSISCYGYGRPWTSRRGGERQGQAVTGSLERTGTIPAILGPYNLVDIGTGVLATFATALALYHRLIAGQGQHVGTGPLQCLYQARDGWFFLAATGKDAARLNAVEGLQTANLEASTLEQALREARFAELPSVVWVDCLRQAGVSVTQTVENVGEATMPGLSVRLFATPVRLGSPPHRPGADATFILQELGMADALPALTRAWVLQTSDLPSAW